MAASSRAQVLDLYRAMLRESKHFSAYNYRPGPPTTTGEEESPCLANGYHRSGCFQLPLAPSHYLASSGAGHALIFTKKSYEEIMNLCCQEDKRCLQRK
ncbi:LYR motif-containing protein 4 isoform X5 [Canis lupus familiaris]|uniref:LYR motif-containing protein 4 isoform X5 n=1 Tax=Canis lupus familiaris TaxID=9615 RepID=UPI0015F1353A|nr:LYR motif-containing protein 4 isoform X5 [Canis lupus familiaris]